MELLPQWRTMYYNIYRKSRKCMGYHWRTGYCFLLCISYINADVFRGCATPCEGLWFMLWLLSVSEDVLRHVRDSGSCFMVVICLRGRAAPCEGLWGAGGAPSEERDVKGTRDDGETTQTSLHQVTVTAARERVSLVRVAVSLFPNKTKGQV